MVCIGTGGTISGISEYLLPLLPKLLVVLADPQGSGLYNSIKYGVMYSSTEKEGTRRRHQVDSLVEGIGLNRFTKNFERGQKRIHEAVKITDSMAVGMGRWLIQNDGIPPSLYWGISVLLHLVVLHLVITTFRYISGLMYRIIRRIKFLCKFMCCSPHCETIRSRT